MNSQCLRLTKQQQPVLRLQKKRIKYKIFRCIFGLKSFDCFFIKTEAITHFHAEYFQFQSFSPFAIDFSFILWDYFGLRSKNGMLSVHDFIFQCLFSVFNIDGNLCLHALCILYEKFMWDVCNLYVISFGIDWQDDENISSKLTMNEKKNRKLNQNFLLLLFRQAENGFWECFRTWTTCLCFFLVSRIYFTWKYKFCYLFHFLEQKLVRK